MPTHTHKGPTTLRVSVCVFISYIFFFFQVFIMLNVFSGNKKLRLDLLTSTVFFFVALQLLFFPFLSYQGDQINWKGLKALVSRRWRPAAPTVSYRCDSFAERWWRGAVSFSPPRRGCCSRHESHLLTALITAQILWGILCEVRGLIAPSALFRRRRSEEEDARPQRWKRFFIDPLSTNTAEKRWNAKKFSQQRSISHTARAEISALKAVCRFSPRSHFLTLSLEIRHTRVVTWKSTHHTTDNHKPGSAKDPACPIFKVSRQKTSTLMHAEATQLRHPSTWRHFARTAATTSHDKRKWWL